MGNATVHFIRYAHERKDYFIGFCLPIMPLLSTSQLDTSAFEAESNVLTCHFYIYFHRRYPTLVNLV